MSAQEILTLAKQGDPTAIGAFISYYTKPQGIKLRVQRQDNCLHILMEANRALNRQRSTEFVHGKLNELDIESIQQAIVYGRRSGHKLPDWQQSISLTPTHEVSDLMTQSEQPNVIESSPGSPPDLQPAQFDEIPEAESIAADATSPPPAIEPSIFDEATPIPDLLNRPEAVIFIILLSLLIFWDTYLMLAEESSATLSSGQLARRLGTNRKIIKRMKRQPGFSEWTRGLDPEGTAWVYSKGVYLPQ